MAKKPSQEEPELSFEQALEELEATVHRLEDGQLGLDEALECYEGGVARLKRCYALLRRAERRIELVRGVDAAGDSTTESLDDPAETLQEKADSRSRRRARPPRRGSAGDSTKMDSPESLF